MDIKGVNDIRCKNSVISWYITERNGNTCIVLAEDIHVIGLNKNGNRIRERNEKIEIPLNQISWTSTPIPETLKLKNNFDFAAITVIREVTRPAMPESSRRPMESLDTIQETDSLLTRTTYF